MNNRLFFAAFVTLLLSFSARGQNEKFSVGVEAGPNMGMLYGDQLLLEDYKPALGYSVGVSFQYNFPKLFSIRAKVAYEGKGAKNVRPYIYNSHGVKVYNVEILNRLNYISIPVVARITLGDKFKFLGDLGGFLGVLTKSTIKSTDDRIIDEGSDHTKNTRRIDYGVSAGVGIGVEISENFQLSVLVRNNLGLYATNTTNFLVGIDYCFGSRE